MKTSKWVQKSAIERSTSPQARRLKGANAPLDLQPVIANPQTASPEAIQAMQQQAGNQAVLDWLQPPTAGESLGPELSSTIQAAHGSGQALPGRLREQMEHRLRADFGPVRIHIDDQANTLNQQIGAKAFTVGTDIFFQRGAYSPNSAEGQRTLKHELSHVVQQKGKVTPHLRLGPENDAHEKEAQRVSRGMGLPQAGAAPAGHVQCIPNPFKWLRNRFRRKKPYEENYANQAAAFEKAANPYQGYAIPSFGYGGGNPDFDEKND